jgi:hypothetical protein
MSGACVLHCKVCRASDAGIKKMQICMIVFKQLPANLPGNWGVALKQKVIQKIQKNDAN